MRFKEIYSLNFELNGSYITEPEQGWIDSEDQIKGKTVALDGEKESGQCGPNRFKSQYQKLEY